MEIVQDQLAVRVCPVIRPTYTKPYPDWIDQSYPWPRGYKVTKFSLFTGLGEVSTLEHVGRFTLQSGEVNDYHKLRLFPSSLTRVAFSWFINLPANSVQTWQQMEQLFHAQFYKTESEVTLVDLANLRQLPNEWPEVNALCRCQKRNLSRSHKVV